MTRFRFAALILTAAIFANHAAAQTGQIRVLCSNGNRAAVEKLTPEAEKAVGRKLSIEFSKSSSLKEEIDGGAAFDFAILTSGTIADLAKSGKVAAGSATNLASVDLGVGVRAASAKSDVGTPDGMKKRLLAAKTLTWTDGGAAAAPILAMFKGLGIEDQMKPKIVLEKEAGRAEESVAEGKNELVLAPVSEIQMVKGLQVLGVFPPAYQQPITMTAGIAAHAKDPAGAKALMKFLTSAKAAAVMKAAGMKPAAN